MGIKQYTVGKRWEQEIISYYHKKGYFAYKIPTEFNGTLFDIIIAKNGSCMFIEAKHTKTNKLYYKGSGIYKKREELDRFIEKTNNNIFIFIKSDTLGYYWTTWLKSKDLFEKQGYLDLKKDCFCANGGGVNV